VRWLERRDPERSAAFYAAALEVALPPPTRARAAWRLGMLWRRAGRAAEARALWAGVIGAGGRVPLGLLVDLAKLHEHHAGDLVAALAVTRVALAQAEADDLEGWRPTALEALHRRTDRLTRRIARRPDGGAPSCP